MTYFTWRRYITERCALRPVTTYSSNHKHLSWCLVPQRNYVHQAGSVLAQITNVYLVEYQTLPVLSQPLPVEGPPHPAGVKLTRPGYYTIPSMDELAQMVNSDGNCFVEELTIGRENYGSVFFYGVINVAGLDLDSIGEGWLAWELVGILHICLCVWRRFDFFGWGGWSVGVCVLMYACVYVCYV